MITHNSPSGKYKLLANENLCMVVDKNEREIAKINRKVKLSYLFFIKNNQEWLEVDRTHQTHVFINLDIGEVFSMKDEFCWMECSISKDGNTLAVHGCVWGGAYEYIFYDFADPFKGITQLKCDEELVTNFTDDLTTLWKNNTFIYKAYMDFNNKYGRFVYNLEDQYIILEQPIPEDIDDEKDVTSVLVESYQLEREEDKMICKEKYRNIKF